MPVPRIMPSNIEPSATNTAASPLKGETALPSAPEIADVATTSSAPDPSDAPDSRPSTSPSRTPTSHRSRPRRERHKHDTATDVAVQHAARKRREIVRVAGHSVVQTPTTAMAVASGRPVNLHFRIPERLARPTVKQLNPDVLKACGDEISKVPVEYIVAELKDVGPKMLASIRRQNLPTAAGPVPTTIEVIVDDLNTFLPSHTLAVFSQADFNQPGPRRVQYFPVHDIVLAVNCTNLPAMPKNTKPVPKKAGDTMKLPVVTLSVPNSMTFPLLFNYLYTKHPGTLVPVLLPGLNGGMTSMAHIIAHLTRLSSQILTRQIFLTHQLWQNVCALGVHDEPLFQCIDMAWGALLQALTLAGRGQGQPQGQIPSSAVMVTPVSAWHAQTTVVAATHPPLSPTTLAPQPRTPPKTPPRDSE